MPTFNRDDLSPMVIFGPSADEPLPLAVHTADGNKWRIRGASSHPHTLDEWLAISPTSGIGYTEVMFRTTEGNTLSTSRSINYILDLLHNHSVVDTYEFSVLQEGIPDSGDTGETLYYINFRVENQNHTTGNKLAFGYSETLLLDTSDELYSYEINIPTTTDSHLTVLTGGWPTSSRLIYVYATYRRGAEPAQTGRIDVCINGDSSPVTVNADGFATIDLDEVDDWYVSPGDPSKLYTTITLRLYGGIV